LTGSAANPPPPPGEPPSPPENPATSAWKTEVSARVRAHRNRSSDASADQPLLPGMENPHPPGSSIAARVAERYTRLPSYRDVLSAQSATPDPSVDSLPADASESPQAARGPDAEDPPAPAQPACEPHQPELLRYSVSSDSLPEPRFAPVQARAESLPQPDPGGAMHFVDPLEEALVEPTQPLPAQLLSSPRELVAPLKARPRLAEGPLWDDSAAQPHTLNPDALVAHGEPPVSHSPAETRERTGSGLDPAGSSSMPQRTTPRPEWLSIQLDTDPRPGGQKSSSPTQGPRIHVALLEDRGLAALIDCGLTLCAFLLFCLVFAICTTSLPHGRAALLGACAALFAMGLLYQLLFFSLADATPGMRYAKIALCTFSDENPTRAALRGRIAALLLSALPLGLGFLWILFDEDGLGWHDRITQTYQRSYRDP
jgi:uncharacterized RDD family membrane protein YckC